MVAAGHGPRCGSTRATTPSRIISAPMSANYIVVWNARDLNSRARRNFVWDIVDQHRASIVCLQESKVADLSVTMNVKLTGSDFDYAYLPAVGVAGGVVTSWRHDL